MKWALLHNRAWRWLATVLILLILLAGAGIVYQEDTSAKDRSTYSPPGDLMQVNGHNTHLYCIGEGSPTVILETGVGGNTLLWAYIQPAVAETTRVCAYDRAGYGWSQARSAARTTAQMAEELHSLLSQADVEPPYILAGHSFGGLVIRSFAGLYPNDVVGVVMIDAVHPNQFASEDCIPACFPVSAVQLVDTFYDILPTMARIGLVRLLVSSETLPLPFFPVPADFPNRNALIASFSTNAHSDSVVAEWNAFPQSAEVVNEINDLGHLPVRLITALHTYAEQPLPGQDAEETTQIWRTLQRDLLRVSTDTKQTVLADATHFSLLVNPNHAMIVSKVIQELVEELS